MDLRSLLSCFSVTVVSIAMWGYLPDAIVARPVARKIALGLLMGLGAVGSMLIPMQIEPGLIFDLRSPVLTAAGFVGGPVAAAFAASLALIYRGYLGGIGLWAGVANILVVSAVGVLGCRLSDRRKPERDLVVVSGVAALAGFLAIFFLPQEKWAAVLGVAGPFMLLNFGCTWLFALSLLRASRLRELIRTDLIYREVIRTLPDSLNAKDEQGRFLAANPATARLMQADSVEALIGRTDFDFYPGLEAEKFRAEELQVLAGETVGPMDQQVNFADGTSRWLTSLKTPLRDDTNCVVGVVTHNRDVTDRKRLEADLWTAQSYLREAMANMADALVIFDPNATIRFCNRQYADLFPRTRELRVAGATLAVILEESVRRGEEAPSGSVADWIAERLGALHEVGDRVFELTDGRIIEARSRPIGADTLVMFSDVTARKLSERELLRRATHDPLTGLANRAEFELQLKAAWQRATARPEPFAVLMLDLDRFKQVNDSFGHGVGDRLLIEVAERLRSAARSGDTVARLGGDEFAILVNGSDVETGAELLAERVLRSLRQTFQVDGIAITPGGSVGIAMFTGRVADATGLIRAADQALYAAKRQGGGVWVKASNETGSAEGPASASQYAA